MNTYIKRLILALQKADDEMEKSESMVLIHQVDSAGLHLYTDYPENGGKLIASFPNLRADSITG